MRSFTALALLSAASLASAEAIEGLVRRGSTSEVCACISGEVKLDGFFSGLSAGTLGTFFSAHLFVVTQIFY